MGTDVPPLRRRTGPFPGVTALLVLGLAAGLLGPGCGPAPPEEKPWNVLLVTFDTTRADRIGCYGNERIETPAVDSLAAAGIRFSRALAPVPITAPSHSTIHTGRYPIAHGVRDNGLFVLADEQLTLAEILKEQGYATAAAVGAYPLTSRFGLSQGFDLFDDHLTGHVEDYLGKRAVAKDRLFFDERRAAQVNESLLPWLAEHAVPEAERPFFAWVHYFDPHQPFEAPAPYDQLYADEPYDAEIAYADSRLAFLLRRLEALGTLDRTLVVMTADHGEGLGEHNELTHAILAYNSTLHVPLIIRPPAGAAPAGTVVDRWVGTVDILPTVLDLLGLERPEGLQGRSLAPLWKDVAAGRADTASASAGQYYAENLSPRLTHGWGEFRVLFDGPLKYIHGPRQELYDVDADPHERHDLLPERPEDGERLRRMLEHFIARNAVAGVSSMEAIDDEVRARLESLGYLHSSSSAGETVSEKLTTEGIAPQDRVQDINDLSAAKHLLFNGQLTDALHFTTKLTAADPENPLYLELHASALGGLGRLEEAWEAAEHLQAQGKGMEDLVLRLSAASFEVGDRERALRALQASLDKTPEARGFWLLAHFHRSLEEPEKARAALEQALATDPAFYPARVDLAARLAEAGRPAEAEAQLQRAVQDGPYYAKAFYNYGTLTLHEERYAEAAAHFRRAASLSPRHLDAHLGLLIAYLGAEDRAGADRTYQDLQRLGPNSRQAQTAAELLAES